MNAKSQITPCIFGTTNGFEIQTLTRVPLNVEDLVFAITRSEVELLDQHHCVKIFRQRVKAEVFTWIGLYRKTFEIGFSREGGYYGAGVWLAGITVDNRLVLDVLNDLADQMNALAITGGRFQKPISNIIDEMKIPASLVPLKESSEHYRGGGLLPEAGQGAYICQLESQWEVVDLAQSNVLAEKFRSMIIAPAASFPRGASSRLERYADLTEVVRELASDLFEKIAGLEAINLTLQKQAAALERDLSGAQIKAEKFEKLADREIEKLAKEAEQWEKRYRKLEMKVPVYSTRADGRRFVWLKYLVYLALFVIAVVGIYFLSVFVYNRVYGKGSDPVMTDSAVSGTKNTNGSSNLLKNQTNSDDHPITDEERDKTITDAIKGATIRPGFYDRPNLYYSPNP